LSTRRTGLGMLLAAAVGALLLLTYIFSGLIERRQSVSLPASQNIAGRTEVVLQADRKGHFVAPGRINGQSVRFLVDTGATLVSVPASLAGELGLERTVPVGLETAAGPVSGWMTRADQVQLGDIVRHDVAVAISPANSDTVLLGMSFLRHLDLDQKGGRLRMTALKNEESLR